MIEYRQLIQILAMFMIVQFFGLLLATQVFNGLTSQQVSGTQTITTSVNVIFIIAYMVVFAVILIFIMKIYKGKSLFLILEGAVVFVASLFVFLVILGILQGNGSAFSNLFGNLSIPVFALAILLSFGLIAAKYKFPKLRNVTAIIASVGVGLVLGISFSFLAALIFMVLLAIYDFIAVFITKHMIALGNMAIENNLSLLVMVNEVEAVPLSSLNKSEKREYEKSKKELKRQGGILDKIIRSDMVPVAARTALGTGDLAIPLMLAISAYKVHYDFVLPFVVIIGAIFGLILTLFILRRFRRALPAIPPLLFGILVALGVYFLVIAIKL